MFAHGLVAGQNGGVRVGDDPIDDRVCQDLLLYRPTTESPAVWTPTATCTWQPLWTRRPAGTVIMVVVLSGLFRNEWGATIALS